jgi:hypothetical protein
MVDGTALEVYQAPLSSESVSRIEKYGDGLEHDDDLPELGVHYSH